MTVTNSGQVSNTGDAYLGAFPGSSGAVTVNGPGSAWTIFDYDEDEATGHYIGFAGTGTVAVTNAGTVNAAQATNGVQLGTFGALILRREAEAMISQDLPPSGDHR